MKRKDFLRGIGVASAASLVKMPLSAIPVNALTSPPPSCVLIPTETAGPFPLDLSENAYYFRQDIRETQTGILYKVKLKVVGQNNCEPMQNVRVNIWHCNKDGLYSGYNGNGNAGQLDLTYLRGYQYTDANGEVEFTTIFPGWYNGRICHIHFQIHVSATYSAISQFTFPLVEKNQLYLEHSDFYTKGVDPLNYSQDNIFSDGHDYQVATLTPLDTGDGYESFLEVTVQGSGTTGLSNIEKETAKIMELGQNFPNPYFDQTTIPLTLNTSSRVSISLWNLAGQKIITILNDQKLDAGKHEFSLSDDIHGISTGSFVYEVQTINEKGIFKSSKMMTKMR